MDQLESLIGGIGNPERSQSDNSSFGFAAKILATWRKRPKKWVRLIRRFSSGGKRDV
jgi:hypothetical protein